MLKFDVTKRIKDLCNAYSWTYYRLAKESDITYSTLSYVEQRDYSVYSYSRKDM